MALYFDLVKNIYLANPGITPALFWVELCKAYNITTAENRYKLFTTNRDVLKINLNTANTADIKVEIDLIDDTDIARKLMKEINDTLKTTEYKSSDEIPLINLLKTYLTCYPNLLNEFDEAIREKLAIEPYRPIYLLDNELEYILSFESKNIDELNPEILNPLFSDINFILNTFDVTAYKPRLATLMKKIISYGINSDESESDVEMDYDSEPDSPLYRGTPDDIEKRDMIKIDFNSYHALSDNEIKDFVTPLFNKLARIKNKETSLNCFYALASIIPRLIKEEQGPALTKLTECIKQIFNDKRYYFDDRDQVIATFKNILINLDNNQIEEAIKNIIDIISQQKDQSKPIFIKLLNVRLSHPNYDFNKEMINFIIQQSNTPILSDMLAQLNKELSRLFQNSESKAIHNEFNNKMQSINSLWDEITGNFVESNYGNPEHRFLDIACQIINRGPNISGKAGDEFIDLLIHQMDDTSRQIIICERLLNTLNQIPANKIDTIIEKIINFMNDCRSNCNKIIASYQSLLEKTNELTSEQYRQYSDRISTLLTNPAEILSENRSAAGKLLGRLSSKMPTDKFIAIVGTQLENNLRSLLTDHKEQATSNKFSDRPYSVSEKMKSIMINSSMDLDYFTHLFTQCCQAMQENKEIANDGKLPNFILSCIHKIIKTKPGILLEDPLKFKSFISLVAALINHPKISRDIVIDLGDWLLNSVALQIRFNCFINSFETEDKLKTFAQSCEALISATVHLSNEKIINTITQKLLTFILKGEKLNNSVILRAANCLFSLLPHISDDAVDSMLMGILKESNKMSYFFEKNPDLALKEITQLIHRSNISKRTTIINKLIDLLLSNQIESNLGLKLLATFSTDIIKQKKYLDVINFITKNYNPVVQEKWNESTKAHKQNIRISTCQLLIELLPESKEIQKGDAKTLQEIIKIIIYETGINPSAFNHNLSLTKLYSDYPQKTSDILINIAQKGNEIEKYSTFILLLNHQSQARIQFEEKTVDTVKDAVIHFLNLKKEHVNRDPRIYELDYIELTNINFLYNELFKLPSQIIQSSMVQEVLDELIKHSQKHPKDFIYHLNLETINNAPDNLINMFFDFHVKTLLSYYLDLTLNAENIDRLINRTSESKRMSVIDSLLEKPESVRTVTCLSLLLSSLSQDKQNHYIYGVLADKLKDPKNSSQFNHYASVINNVTTTRVQQFEISQHSQLADISHLIIGYNK